MSATTSAAAAARSKPNSPSGLMRLTASIWAISIAVRHSATFTTLPPALPLPASGASAVRSTSAGATVYSRGCCAIATSIAMSRTNTARRLTPGSSARPRPVLMRSSLSRWSNTSSIRARKSALYLRAGPKSCSGQPRALPGKARTGGICLAAAATRCSSIPARQCARSL